ncbi:PPOX class F420-dependent oxidoreductase [Microcella sp.]|uniref:PPOX class F420-dependent oxidoreductase n=1 Tax=Microcella sp. TaxID=1913979 RepID=UPI00391C5467
MTDPVVALADEQYVLLTTTRRSGVAVATPVWVARHDEALLVTTGADAGKVKRIRHTPRVTLQACDRVGRPLDGAPVVEAVASVHDDVATRAQLDAALSEKYGVQYAAIRAMGRLRGRAASSSVALRLVAPSA